MTENSNKNQKLKEENEQLCAKVKSLIEQYEKREEVSAQILFIQKFLQCSSVLTKNGSFITL